MVRETARPCTSKTRRTSDASIGAHLSTSAPISAKRQRHKTTKVRTSRHDASKAIRQWHQVPPGASGVDRRAHRGECAPTQERGGQDGTSRRLGCRTSGFTTRWSARFSACVGACGSSRRRPTRPWSSGSEASEATRFGSSPVGPTSPASGRTAAAGASSARRVTERPTGS